MLKVNLINTFVTAMGKFDVRIIQNGLDTMGPKRQESENVYIPSVSILAQAFAAHRSVNNDRGARGYNATLCFGTCKAGFCQGASVCGFGAQCCCESDMGGLSQENREAWETRTPNTPSGHNKRKNKMIKWGGDTTENHTANSMFSFS